MGYFVVALAVVITAGFMAFTTALPCGAQTADPAMQMQAAQGRVWQQEQTFDVNIPVGGIVTLLSKNKYIDPHLSFDLTQSYIDSAVNPILARAVIANELLRMRNAQRATGEVSVNAAASQATVKLAVVQIAQNARIIELLEELVRRTLPVPPAAP